MQIFVPTGGFFGDWAGKSGKLKFKTFIKQLYTECWAWEQILKEQNGLGVKRDHIYKYI